jgi:hypothetical protein
VPCADLDASRNGMVDCPLLLLPGAQVAAAVNYPSCTARSRFNPGGSPFSVSFSPCHRSAVRGEFVSSFPRASKHMLSGSWNFCNQTS